MDAAETVAQALGLLPELHDVVVLDLMLPDGDGLTILQAIRRERAAARVVVTTGSGDSSRLARVRALDPDALLTKPINLAQLFGALGLSR